MEVIILLKAFIDIYIELLPLIFFCNTVCMYVFVYECRYVCMYVCNVYFVCIDVAHIHACIYVCLYVCMQTVQPSRFRQDYPDLKILNPNQCVIRIGIIPISTRVVIFLSNSHKKKKKCRKL